MHNSPSVFRRLGPWLAALCFLVARAPGATVQTVYFFGPAPDGTAPIAALLQTSDGNLYGTASNGGANGTGTVFRYNPFTGVYTILHSFAALGSGNVNADGAGPRGTLIQGLDGNLYGTTSSGGAFNKGTAFRLTSAGVFTTLHSFDNTDGGNLVSGLLQTSDGALYGTTNVSAGATYGTVFRMTTAGTVTTLHTFSLGNDGGHPHGGLALGTDGNLYGTTSAGGVNGSGTVFKITPTGTLTTLHGFNNADGDDPEGTLCLGTDGNFYGTTQSGGVNSNGTVFRITPGGTFTLLYQFAGGQPGATDGSNPVADLVQGPDGNFFSTTYAGGSADQHGTIFSITPTGTLTTLYRFTGGDDGENPLAALTLNQRGDFFGVSNNAGSGGGGTIFALNVHGVLSFSAASANVSENAGSVTLMVNRTGSGAGAVGVTYATEDGTALAGTDYTATTGTLSWADGDLSPKTIVVPVTDRHIYDNSTRTFDVALSFPTGGVVLQSPAVENVNILENDTIPTQPDVFLDSPANDNTTILIGSTLTIAARVNDPDGALAAVQFTVNGATVGTAGAAGPYVFTGLAPTAPGTYAVGVIATDTLGRVSSSTHTITVRAQAATGDPSPSAVILTDLNNRAVGVGQTIPISAVAATSNGDPLAEVDFYADGVVIARFDGAGVLIDNEGITRPPRRADAPVPASGGTVFQTGYVVPGGKKLVNLLVVAFSKLGVASVSTPATIRPTDPSKGKPPGIGLSGLGDGATVPVGAPTTVAVNVTLPEAENLASPARGVHRQDAASQLADLAFYLNATLVAHATRDGDPTKQNFTFTPPSAGDYVIEAIATDTKGISGVATPITIHAAGASTVVTVVPSGDGRAQFGVENGKVAVRRTGNTTAALTVFYKLKGAAKLGVDFKGPTGMVVIPAGAAQVKIKLKPLLNPLNTGVLKTKIMIQSVSDGSYQLGDTTVAKIKVVGGG